MRQRLFLLFLVFTCASRAQSFRNGEELLQHMHNLYYKAPCECYSFSQKNTHYRNDSVIGHSEWHEEIRFPDRFRIAFGIPADGNFVQFRNDSALRFRAGKFVNARTDTNQLLLLLGGMYYRNFGETLLRLKQAGYHTDQLSHRTWHGKDVFVLGAGSTDSLSNQVWIDKSEFKVLRIMENMAAGDRMDMRFEAHERSCKGWMESKVSFRRNGRLEQTEEYYNIRPFNCSQK